MSRQPAHHSKIECEDRYAPQLRELHNAWRMRLALHDMGKLLTVDPLTPRQRFNATRRLNAYVKSAGIFLACRTARIRYASRSAVRASMKLVAGGRS